MDLDSNSIEQLIEEDYIQLTKEKLDVTPETAFKLYILAIPGRSSLRSGAFKGRAIIINHRDAARALCSRINKVFNVTIDKQYADRFIKLQTGRSIKEARDFVYNLIEHRFKPPARLSNNDGLPLLGINEYLRHDVDTLTFLKNVWLGTMMDNAKARKKAEKKYSVCIDCGEKGMKYKPSETYNGVHDGFAVIVAGLKAGDADHYSQPDSAVSAGIGVNFADAIDTLDKNCNHETGNLGQIIEENASIIEKNYGCGFELDEDELHDFIFLSANPATGTRFVSPSTRDLNFVHGSYSLTPLQHYLSFLGGKILPDISVGCEDKRERIYDEYRHVLGKLIKHAQFQPPKHCQLFLK